MFLNGLGKLLKKEEQMEKQKKMDRRTRYTRQIIKEALLKGMETKSFAKMTVTQICRDCEINRGTFYLHYFDLEDVLDALIMDALADTSDMLDHVLCPNKTDCTYPFCEKIQNNQHYHALFFDEIASARFLDRVCDQYKENFVTRLMQNSALTFEQAEAIFYFQMNGCLTINKMMLKNNCSDWRKIQETIDRFIKSGIEGFLIHWEE